MRSLAIALSCALAFASAVFAAGEPEPAPLFEEKKTDVWEWAPHLTVRYGKTTQGYYRSRYWYRIQDRRFDVSEARTYEADLSAGRWSVSGSVTRVPDQPDIRGSAFGLNLTPVPLGPVRPGIGLRYQKGQDATVLFSSGGTSIASASQRQLITAVLDLGFGRYDRSNFRVQSFYGNARLNDSLDLVVGGRIAQSPLARHHFSHSDFYGVGAAGAVRLYGLSLEGSVACYRPDRPSVALPGDECVMSGGGSVLLPVWLKFGSGAGAFIRYTRVDTAKRPTDHQSLQFLNDSVTFGFTARIP